MSAVDQGLDAAVQRVMRAIGCVRSGESWDGYVCMWHAGLFWDTEADACPEALDAARAAREDVPALTQQARADELEHFAEHHIRNQSAGRIVEDLFERAAAIREGREP